VIPWLMNTLGAILRGTGNMKLPSAIILTSAACQILLGGILCLGLGRYHNSACAASPGSLIAYSISASIMAWYIFSGRARVRPASRGSKSGAACCSIS
jgi:Na+-driven multidrug efflux pump